MQGAPLHHTRIMEIRMPIARSLAPALAAALTAGLAPLSAHAQDGPTFPRVEVEIPMELQNDHVIESDDSDAEINDLFATIEPGVSLRFT